MVFLSNLASAVLLAAALVPAISANSCQPNEFWYEARSCCLQSGGPPSKPPPPSNYNCPPSPWYWHEGQGCCVPEHDSPPQPQCPNNWVWSNWRCVPPPSPAQSCKNNEFWWEPQQCCLPNGGSTGPTPPGGNQCPSSWYWHTGKNCCVPGQQSPPPPTCPNKYNWDGTKCCPPAPQPSGHKRRSIEKPLGDSRCPSGLTACPIPGSLSDSYECLDSSSELESCGGCVSLGQGRDCSAIIGAWDVGCYRGRCRVFTCEMGYTPDFDGQTCIPL